VSLSQQNLGPVVGGGVVVEVVVVGVVDVDDTSSEEKNVRHMYSKFNSVQSNIPTVRQQIMCNVTIM
jgi:hypothetical protein